MRKVTAALRDPAFDPNRLPAIGARLTDRVTPRVTQALDLARQAAGAGAHVGTGQMLAGILDQGDNLACAVLRALDVDLGELRAAVGRADDDEPMPEATAERRADAAGAGAVGDEAAGGGDDPAGDGDPSPWTDMTMPARRAVAAALEAVIAFGHNYVGCEHLLLGLLAEADSHGGRALRDHGVEPAAARRSITATLSGYAHARKTPAPAGAGAIDEIMRRLDAIETRHSTLGP